MKQTLTILIFALFLCGCAHEATYNQTLLKQNQDETTKLSKPKILIYIPDIKAEELSPQSALGKDQILSINLYKFSAQAVQTFIKQRYQDVTLTSDAAMLHGAQVVIYPVVLNFVYGFKDIDNFGISAKTYISYDFRLKISSKNNGIVFDNLIGSNGVIKSKNELFFGDAKESFASISPLFQEALQDNLNAKKDSIFTAIQ